jgi:hypothetical protein
MSFSFGFHSNDIEESAEEVVTDLPEPASQWPSEVTTPKHHDLKSLVRRLLSFHKSFACIVAATFISIKLRIMAPAHRYSTCTCVDPDLYRQIEVFILSRTVSDCRS